MAIARVSAGHLFLLINVLTIDILAYWGGGGDAYRCYD